MIEALDDDVFVDVAVAVENVADVPESTDLSMSVSIRVSQPSFPLGGEVRKPVGKSASARRQ